MTSSAIITPGKAILSVVALVTGTGCYAADWSPTHILNPRWPPHAKFHTGQTMSMGAGLGLLTTYFTWRPTVNPQDSIFTAAMLGSLYYITGLSAILYPGTRWTDPEFGEGSAQSYFFSTMLGLSWVGYWLETRRLGGSTTR